MEIKRKRIKYMVLPKFVFFALMLVLPFLLKNNYHLRIYGLLVINMIVSIGLNMAVGVAGQINLGQAGLVGTGAYAFAILLQKGVAWPLAAMGALTIGVFWGVAFGYISNRLAGPYLAIVSLAFNLVFTIVINNEVAWTGGPFGLKILSPIGLTGACIVSAALFLALYFIATGVYHSHLGRCFRSIRDDELSAKAYGINPLNMKVVACVFSSFLAAIGGILQACTFGYVAPTSFTVTQSFRYLAMIVVGGLGYLPGTFFGPAAITLIPEFLRWLTGLWDIVLGTTIIILLLFFPEGFGYVGKYVSNLFAKVKVEERWTGTIKEEIIEKLGGLDE